MNSHPRSSCIMLVGFITTTALLGGCAHQHALVVGDNSAGTTLASIDEPVSDPTVESDTIAASMMFNELGLGINHTWPTTVNSNEYAAPQLVAGDWLAWQCAIVGGYWDMPNENAPAFAEALESDLVIE